MLLIENSIILMSSYEILRSQNYFMQIFSSYESLGWSWAALEGAVAPTAGRLFLL